MILDAKQRAAVVNGLLGMPYRLGAAGPEAFDCYGLARHLQKVLYGLDLPPFEAPADAGRAAIAAFMGTHPERVRWQPIVKPADGAMVSMAKQDVGYHVGVFVALDGGVIVHCIEGAGVIADRPFTLGALGWRRLQYFARTA